MLIFLLLSHVFMRTGTVMPTLGGHHLLGTAIRLDGAVRRQQSPVIRTRRDQLIPLSAPLLIYLISRNPRLEALSSDQEIMVYNPSEI
jgi:hypothetical protein